MPSVIGLTRLPFAFIGCALTPWITMVAVAALNVTSTTSPSSPPSTV